jgi:hypothetical protein
LCILIFAFLDSRREDKSFWTEWYCRKHHTNSVSSWFPPESNFDLSLSFLMETRYRRRNSDWLRAGRLRGQSLSPGSSRIFSSPRRPDRLWGAPSFISNGCRWLFPGGKAAEAWNWPFTSKQCRGEENVDLYIHSSIRFHGVVLN